MKYKGHVWDHNLGSCTRCGMTAQQLVEAAQLGQSCPYKGAGYRERPQPYPQEAANLFAQLSESRRAMGQITGQTQAARQQELNSQMFHRSRYNQFAAQMNATAAQFVAATAYPSNVAQSNVAQYPLGSGFAPGIQQYFPTAWTLKGHETPWTKLFERNMVRWMKRVPSPVYYIGDATPPPLALTPPENLVDGPWLVLKDEECKRFFLKTYSLCQVDNSGKRSFSVIEGAYNTQAITRPYPPASMVAHVGGAFVRGLAFGCKALWVSKNWTAREGKTADKTEGFVIQVTIGAQEA